MPAASISSISPACTFMSNEGSGASASLLPRQPGWTRALVQLTSPTRSRRHSDSLHQRLNGGIRANPETPGRKTPVSRPGAAKAADLPLRTWGRLPCCCRLSGRSGVSGRLSSMPGIEPRRGRMSWTPRSRTAIGRLRLASWRPAKPSLAPRPMSYRPSQKDAQILPRHRGCIGVPAPAAWILRNQQVPVMARVANSQTRHSLVLLDRSTNSHFLSTGASNPTLLSKFLFGNQHALCSN